MKKILLLCFFSLVAAEETIPIPKQPQESTNLESPKTETPLNAIPAPVTLSEAQPVLEPAISAKPPQEPVQYTPPQCDPHIYGSHAALRHIEGKGIGYNQGYTTVELFFSPKNGYDSMLIFGDLRGHIFNNGKLAANAGIGMRFLVKDRICGWNAYYDYRNTKRQHYHQIALGFESLGERWDVRINGYLPVGNKKSPFFDKTTELDISSGSLESNTHFEGHFLIIGGNAGIIKKRKIEFALKSADAELGFHVTEIKNIDLYIGAGPYYLNGHFDRHAFGGKGRASAKIFQYGLAEASVSYDSIFNSIVQGQIGINIPFGKKPKTPSMNLCSNLGQRWIAPVQRNEIIPVDQYTKTATTSGTGNVPAIDPATGRPYYFIFVNNTSSSDGTFEHPFPTLAQAEAASQPNNIIYVFSGDGTTTGMNTGFVLQTGQRLLGSGIPHTFATQFGPVTVPALTSIAPTITNLNPASVITLANNTEVSGFNVNATINNTAISVIDVSNITITNNSIQNAASITEFGINISPSSGTLTINQNTLQVIGVAMNEIGFRILIPDSAVVNMQIANNQIQNYGVGIDTAGLTASVTTGSIANNILINSVQYGINFSFENASQGTIFVTNNALIGIVDFDAILLSASNNAIANWNVASNTFTNVGASPLVVESANSAATCVSFVNNQTNTGSYSFQQSSTNPFFLFQMGNIGTINTVGVITAHPEGCP